MSRAKGCFALTHNLLEERLDSAPLYRPQQHHRPVSEPACRGQQHGCSSLDGGGGAAASA